MNWYKKAQYNQYGVPLDFETNLRGGYYDTISDEKTNWVDPKTHEYKTGPMKDYTREVEGYTSKIEWMSPDEYIYACAGDSENKEESIRFMTETRRRSYDHKGRNLIEEYKKRWINGENPPMGYLIYVNGKYWGQEGLHRAIMAKDIGVDLIPVLVINRKR